MYNYVKGFISVVNPKYIVVDNNGIGYQIMVSNPYDFKINEPYKVYTHLNIKEDAHELYGFKTEAERDFFLKLISVKGIGPKTSLAILASANVNDLICAIENADAKFLRKYPGIGPKASQQIILDLKGKISLELLPNNSNANLQEVEEALLSLGYNKKEISKVLDKLDSSKPINELIKDALTLF